MEKHQQNEDEEQTAIQPTGKPRQEAAGERLPSVPGARDGNWQKNKTRQEASGERLPLIPGTRDGNQQKAKPTQEAAGITLLFIPGARDGNQQKAKPTLEAAGIKLPPIPIPGARDGNQQKAKMRQEAAGIKLPFIPGARDGNQQKAKPTQKAAGIKLPPIPIPGARDVNQQITLNRRQVASVERLLPSFSHTVQEGKQADEQILPSFIRIRYWSHGRQQADGQNQSLIAAAMLSGTVSLPPRQVNDGIICGWNRSQFNDSREEHNMLYPNCIAH